MADSKTSDSKKVNSATADPASNKANTGIDGNVVDNAVAEGGAYEVIRKRLDEQGRVLQKLTQTLNARRLEEFGGADMEVIGRTRVRTEQNSVARDIVQVGQRLLFGYNVFIGLKKETKISDVLALFDLTVTDDGLQLEPVDIASTFLSEQRFQSDFEELYRYYKDAKLISLVFRDSKLLAGFQIGERVDDIRVFRWSVSPDGNDIRYIDNRGERDIQPPEKYDFEWVETSRDDFVHGRHPHVNILDKVFVETINGDLTVKIEDNTEDGLGIYAEAVAEKNQSMDDASIAYAKVNNLILLAVTPYKEETTRYLVYNEMTESVLRVDAIGQSCVQLPEEQGIMFPGGFYLESGEHKSFTDDVTGLQFKRMYRSPNGEDVLYVFYEPVDGVLALFSYNLITKTTQNPIFSNGYALYDDGKVIVFSAEDEATRVHPMQLWQSPFISTEYASQQPESTTELGKIGNSELVRGVSSLYEISRSIDNQQVSMRLYEALSQASARVFDAHYWLEDAANAQIAETLKEISATSELVIDEFEKVQSIQRQSARVMLETQSSQKKLLATIAATTWENTLQFVDTIHQLREQRGHIITVKDHRYISVAELDQLEQETLETEQELGLQTVEFLLRDDALKPYAVKLKQYQQALDKVEKNADIKPLIGNIDQTTQSLDLLSELVATLPIDDATIRTNVVDAISEIYAKLNQLKARANNKRKNLGSEEAVAQFSAQFKLFSQSITNALGIAETPEKCDEQLSKLLVQLEDLESQFSDYERFLGDIMDKREELYESFETHRQSLVEQQQRRAQAVAGSADRILKSIEKRSLKLADKDKLNTYFASDSLVLKIRDLIAELQALGSAVVADDVDARFKALKEQAIRALRDKSEIFEDGGNVIKLGPKHRFSVNTQELDLTIVPRDEALFFHLTGTDFYEQVQRDELGAMQSYWAMSLESETDAVYRAEYLAHLVIQAAQAEEGDLSWKILVAAVRDTEHLTKLVRDFSTPLYKQGYQKGIHDHDAALIIQQLLPAIETAGLLRFSPQARGLAQLFWANADSWFASASNASANGSIGERITEPVVALGVIKSWPERAVAALKLRELFADTDAIDLLVVEVEQVLAAFFVAIKLMDKLTDLTIDLNLVAHYLVEQLGDTGSVSKKTSNQKAAPKFVRSQYANVLCDAFTQSLGSENLKQFTATLQQLNLKPGQKWQVASAWLNAFVNKADEKIQSLRHYQAEAVANLCCEKNVAYQILKVDLELSVLGLLGEHSRLLEQSLGLSLDDFMQRMHHHQHHVLPSYAQYLDLRNDIMQAERSKIKLDSFKARPLSSFVRNRLINESYLPLIGDNLAKQMGTMGDSKRTDLMGLLMMISPPGYGKTTLMEYVANRLGLIFMKINCPALGHDVMSLDPQQAPNATARQELEKINLAFEMGNNVMLYLDDIQHTHPEFLQKYISLCDGTRRVEGVWRGETKTYDMRGKKFCVVMAGNPYTESGEQFKVPDMLANRADIYNLGDILGGMDEQFALSYIENSLTSNQVLAPLAVRDMQDVYKLVAIAQGHNVPSTDLVHQYSGAEINEITDVLKKMFIIQDIVLKINKEYIASAAQDDRYRVEPPFKLQGSYRNMNKMTEKISAVMNESELMQLIQDHYLGESQLLTTGAEENLLKLAELRGNMTAEQDERWQQILADFKRNKALGGDETDTGNKIATQMHDLVGAVEQLGNLSTSLLENSAQQQAQQVTNAQQLEQQTMALEEKQLLAQQNNQQQLLQVLADINQSLLAQSARQDDVVKTEPAINITNQPLPEFADILANLVRVVETGILPIVSYMEKKFEVDKRTLAKIHDVATEVSELHIEVAENVQTVSKKKTAKKKTTKPTADKKTS